MKQETNKDDKSGLDEIVNEEVKNKFTFKSVFNYIKKISVLSAIALGSFVSVEIGMNQLSNRFEYIGRNSHSIKKPIGLFNSIKLYKYKDEKSIDSEFTFTKGFYFPKGYIDKAENNAILDAKADEIEISKFGKIIHIYRDSHYDSHKSDFDKGDAILAREEPKYLNFFE